MLIAFLGCDIQPNQCFSCAGNTRDKNDMLFTLTRGLLNQFLNPFGSDS